MEQLTNAEIEALLNQMEEMLRKLPDFENDEFLQHLTEFEDCYLKVYMAYNEIDSSYFDRLYALDEQKGRILEEKIQALNNLLSGTSDSDPAMDNHEEWLKKQYADVDLMRIQLRLVKSQMDFLKKRANNRKRDYVDMENKITAVQMQEILDYPEDHTEEEIQEATEFLEWYKNSGEETQEDEGLFRKQK